MPEVFRFEFRLSYLGCIEYNVYGDGPAYRIEVRQAASDYERSIYNGTEEEWQRDCVAAVGLAHRHSENWIPLNSEVMAAFNAWRQAEHEEHVRRLRASPERYGVIPEGDPLLCPPPLIRGAHYEVGKGWILD